MELLNTLDEFSRDKTNEKKATKCVDAVQEFLKQNEKTFKFDKSFSADDHNKLLNIVSELFENNSVQSALTLNCLSILRLLSRDEKLVKNIQNIAIRLQKFLDFLGQKAEEKDNGKELCNIEILKCLCNWIYHSSAVRQHLISSKYTKDIITQMVESKCNIGDCVFYQIRIMFLMSALEGEERGNMLEYNALDVLLEVLLNIDKTVKNEEILSETSSNILSEVLKALFNITLELPNVSSDKLEADCSKLVAQLRNILQTYQLDENNEIITHVSHLFVNLPKASLESFCLKLDTQHCIERVEENLSEHPVVFQGHDMSPVIVLLSALKKRMKIHSYTEMKEKTLSILTAFCYVCRINPLIRKYLRQQILPPLVVTVTRPEEMANVRGDLVRLMTTVDISLKNMAADFLFVLCKENTTRLIRYTGYGNSAGYLASRGLMIPTASHVMNGDYSEDELSDVDDEDLDVMLGAQAQAKKDIFADLTEEEKEAEAEKLGNMFERLLDMNIIKPMAVNNEGKVVEINGDEEKNSD